MELNWLRKISPRTVTIIIITGGILLFAAIVAALLAPQPGEIPSVSQTDPQNGGEVISPAQPIFVTFSQGLTASQQSNLTFSAEPFVTFTPFWLTDDMIQLTPVEPLTFSRDYKVVISFKGRTISEFSFGTPETTPEEFSQDIEELAEGDTLFAKAQLKWHQDNPWYQELPIVTSDYTIVYMFNVNKFRITLTLGENITTEKIDRAKVSAINRIRATGANLNKIGYYLLLP